MLKKVYSADEKLCHVTFELPPGAGTQYAHLCGDFNDWNSATHPMRQNDSGGFSITISLETGHAYQFKYRIDNEVWENDWDVDGYEPNPFGSDNSIVDLAVRSDPIESIINT